MNKFLPSKKFIVTILAIVIAILIIWGGAELVNRKQQTLSQANPNTQLELQKQFMAKDSDNDGLKDWEESLWKTNPKLADTDNDGTNDGDEVRQNRDPLKTNTSKTGQPNDKASEQLIAEQKRTEIEFQELNQTEQISRVLFSEYLAAKNANQLSAADKNTIISTAGAMFEASLIPKYSLSDLKLSADNSNQAIINYVNGLGQAFFTGTTETNVENELVIIDRAVKNANEKELIKLNPIIEGYTKTIAKIELLTVPASLASINLSLLNDLNSIKISLIKIQKLFSDPAQAINGMNIYQKTSAQVVKDFADLRNIISDKNISFDSKDYGYLIVNII